MKMLKRVLWMLWNTVAVFGFIWLALSVYFVLFYND